ncbi:hypothetical protein SFRURICE_010045 [Spodoptera frugiperda]|nr:hypothetical protein SFRURICE_010045 [Spodoptera frugiperda]
MAGIQMRLLMDHYNSSVLNVHDPLCHIVIMQSTALSPPPMTTHRKVGSDLHTATPCDLHQGA